MKQAVFYAKGKEVCSSREYYLADNEVPELVYDNLVKAAVRENIVKLHEYTRVRKEDVLGVDELHMYDLYVPMVAAADRRYTYEEAKSCAGGPVAGEEYLSLLKQGFDSRWIDVYENEGKRSAAALIPGGPTAAIPMCC